MILTPIQAVVFDLDDTLYPEREFAFSGFNAVSHDFADILGEPETAAARMRQLFDTEHRPRVFDRLLLDLGLSASAGLVPKMVDTYRNHKPTIELFDDADALLSQLKTRFKLGLISDGLSATQHAKIAALDLQARLDAIIITSELGPGYEKPHPRAFELMAERLNVAPKACVYVADNVAKDFVAPNKLGWQTVRILRRSGVHKNQSPASEGQAKLHINSLYELTPLLKPPP